MCKNIQNDIQIQISIAEVVYKDEVLIIRGYSKNLGNRKVEVFVGNNNRKVAKIINARGEWEARFENLEKRSYDIQISVRDYSDFANTLQPTECQNSFSLDNANVWGATVTKGDDGLYHMIFSFWEEAFDDWVLYSKLGHAISTSYEGPFEYESVALDNTYSNTTQKEGVNWKTIGGWEEGERLEVFHNPTIMHSKKDGKYYLYFMGTNASKNDFDWWSCRNMQRVGVAYADTPAGPWTVFDKPVLDIKEDTYYDLLTANPSVIEVCKDGKYYYCAIFKTVQNTNNKYGSVVSGFGVSDSPLGPFTINKDPIMVNPEYEFSVEDAYLYYHNGTYYSIAKDMHNYFTKATTQHSYALFESSNGVNWELSNHPLAFENKIPWKDGTEIVERLERAQIYVEDEIPFMLYLATTSKEPTYNVHIPILGNVLVEQSTTIDLSNI